MVEYVSERFKIPVLEGNDALFQTSLVKYERPSLKE